MENGDFHQGDFGVAAFVGERNVADLTVNFGKNPISRFFMKGHYRVVKTDYEGFVFLFTRERIFFFESVVAWVLTREKNVEESVLEGLVDDFLEVTGFKRDVLIFSRRNDVF